MIQLYNIIIYQPLYNLLVFFYNTIPIQDIGLAIIALTIVVKLILIFPSRQSIKSQKALQSIQPKLEALKKEHGDNKEALARATMGLYKAEKVNPFSSCFPMLIQLPFFIALFQVFRSGVSSNDFSLLYPFIANPGSIDPVSFGIINLAVPSIPLAILAGAAQFIQAKMLVSKPQPKVEGAKDEGMAAIMNKQMTYMMPLVTVFIGTRLPGGLSLYWFLTTLLTALQQLIMFKKKNKDLGQDAGSSTTSEPSAKPQQIKENTTQ